MPAALRAGKKHDTPATTMRMAGATNSVNGSRGSTLKRSTRRVSPSTIADTRLKRTTGRTAFGRTSERCF